MILSLFCYLALTVTTKPVNLIAKHVCCIATSLLGVNVDFATQVATLKGRP